MIRFVASKHAGIRWLFRCFVLLLAQLALPSCKTANKNEAQLNEEAPLLSSGQPRFCAAIRGNGHYIMSHFGALSRLAEHFGPFDAIAGGSSGSITAFVYESMLKNPVLRDCGSRPCTADEVSLRLGLMLKSVFGYYEVVKGTSEAFVVHGISTVLEKARQLGVLNAIAETGDLRTKLIELFNQPEIKETINPEIFAMLTVRDPELAVRNAREVLDILQTFGSFNASDQRIFLRPGLFDFKVIARRFGRIASFYAGYAPTDRQSMSSWLRSCATVESRGEFWDEVAKRQGSSGTCGAEFKELVSDYRDKLLQAESNFPSRVDEKIGSVIPVIVPTAILSGQSVVEDTKTQQEKWLRDEPAALVPGFRALKFGYWSGPREQQGLVDNQPDYGDLRTKKRLGLGTVNWSQVLSLSPAEPSLAKVQIMNAEMASAGGWSDLTPTLVLKMAGCEKVVLVTRQGEESPFPAGIAELLGTDQDDRNLLFDLNNSESSNSQAVSAADAIWCTDWNRFSDTEIVAMTKEAFNAVMVVRGEGGLAIQREAVSQYPNVQSEGPTTPLGCGTPRSRL